MKRVCPNLVGTAESGLGIVVNNLRKYEYINKVVGYIPYAVNENAINRLTAIQTEVSTALVPVVQNSASVAIYNPSNIITGIQSWMQDLTAAQEVNCFLPEFMLQANRMSSKLQDGVHKFILPLLTALFNTLAMTIIAIRSKATKTKATNPKKSRSSEK
jgi:hypothetical protein